MTDWIFVFYRLLNDGLGQGADFVGQLLGGIRSLLIAEWRMIDSAAREFESRDTGWMTYHWRQERLGNPPGLPGLPEWLGLSRLLAYLWPKMKLALVPAVADFRRRGSSRRLLDNDFHLPGPARAQRDFGGDSARALGHFSLLDSNHRSLPAYQVSIPSYDTER